MAKDNEALMKALELAKAGDYETALIYVRRLLKREPSNQRASVLRWTLEARLLEKRGAKAEAIARYQQILSVRPDMAEAKRKLEELSAPAVMPQDDHEDYVVEAVSSLPPDATTLDSERPTNPPSVAAKIAPPPPPVPREAHGAVLPAHDRRQSMRVVLDIEIGVHTDTNFYAGFSDDISEGGLFIATYNLLAVGQRFRIAFTLPSGQSIETEVEVRWVRDPLEVDMETIPGMGVRFVALTDAQRRAIHAFMKQRAPIFYEHE